MHQYQASYYRYRPAEKEKFVVAELIPDASIKKYFLKILRAYSTRGKHQTLNFTALHDTLEYFKVL
jgi:hypothetical protein